MITFTNRNDCSHVEEEYNSGCCQWALHLVSEYKVSQLAWNLPSSPHQLACELPGVHLPLSPTRAGGYKCTCHTQLFTWGWGPQFESSCLCGSLPTEPSPQTLPSLDSGSLLVLLSLFLTTLPFFSSVLCTQSGNFSKPHFLPLFIQTDCTAAACIHKTQPCPV